MMKSSTEDLYEGLCAAVRKPISQASAALTAVLKDQTGEDIAGALKHMTGDEATLIFDWLDDERAVAALSFLDEDTTRFIIRHAPPGRIANLDLESVLPMIASAKKSE